jgi:hypothetical protein
MRSPRSWWTKALVTGALLAPTRAFADEPSPYLELRYTQMRLALDDSHFRGFGLAPDGTRVHVDATGQAIGFHAPVFQWIHYGGGLSGPLGPGRLVVGVISGFGWIGSADASPGDPALAASFQTSSAFGIHGALDAGYLWSLGPISLHGSVALGVRWLTMHLDGLRRLPDCVEGTGWKEQPDCGGHANRLQGEIMPRLGIEVRPSTALPLLLEIFGATDVAHPGTVEVGLALGSRFHTPRR